VGSFGNFVIGDGQITIVRGVDPFSIVSGLGVVYQGAPFVDGPTIQYSANFYPTTDQLDLVYLAQPFVRLVTFS
jgi:hypothetical protein